ncbi:MAG: UvrD-helicase domain-containing protein [Melioribacteraceae bacterium]|nr:UvrD-helicase domain-containing protein [Melioribacteraceae bacterium]
MNKLTDHQLKALNFRKHISLTANAGSGKTFVFSERYLQIGIETDTPLSKIAAITFTDKAAAELRIKIEKKLLEKIKDSNIKYKGKLNYLRRQLVSAKISTIHSFCIEVLREYSAYAEIDANFIPIDQRTSEELIELSIEDFLKSAESDNVRFEKLATISRLLGSKNFLITEIRQLLNKREVFFRLKNIYSEEKEAVIENLKNHFESVTNRLFGEFFESVINSISKINQHVLAELQGNELAQLVNDHVARYANNEKNEIKLLKIAAVINLITVEKGTIKVQKYLSKKIDQNLEVEKETINEFVQLWKKIKFDENSTPVWEMLFSLGKDFFDIIESVNSIYEKRKCQNSFIDFDDILLMTQKVLESAEVQTALSKKYDFVMIDEYQDTNELQYKIFMPILNNLENGNLFVVGDDKQSIYRFRNAEIEVFDKTKSDIGSKTPDGETLELPHTFRLTENLTFFSNYLFKNLFADADSFFNEVQHKEMICAGEKSSKGQVEFLISDKNGEVSLPSLVASKIIELKKNDIIDFKNVAILFRTRSDFKLIEEEFINRSIPYTIIGGKGFYQQQLIYDLYNYLAFLLNKENDTALVGILRSPFFVISDIQLFEISHASGNSFWEKLLVYNENNKTKEIESVINVLGQHERLSASGSISNLLSAIFIDTCYYAVASERKDAKQHVANIEKLQKIAVNYSQKAFATLYDFIGYLKSALNTIEDEGHATPDLDKSAVQLMTIHQSKGLEFDTVFIFNANNSLRNTNLNEKSIAIDKTFGVLTKIPLNNYFEKYKTPPILGLYNYVNFRKEFAEFKRLLYVAVTRAKSNLFVSATLNKNAPSENSFMDLIMKGLNRGVSQDFIELHGKIQQMSVENSVPVEIEKEINLNIPVTREIITDEKFTEESNIETNIISKINVEKLVDTEKNEFISATKIAVYSQCPIKYHLIYDLGYGKLQNLLKVNEHEFEYSENEDRIESEKGDLNKFANFKGSVVHALLDKNTKAEFIKEEAENLLINRHGLKTENALIIADQIHELINNYYNSNSYNEINSFSNYRNEFEIYRKLGDIYLYGIVDKLLIEENLITIVDYKTDKLKGESPAIKAENYKNQLTFYSFVLSSLFPKSDFRARLIFLEKPDDPVDFLLSKTDIKSFENDLKSAVENIRKSKYLPNLNHCKSCFFFENNSCVYPS